jgi:hypothetical protein
MYRWRNGRGEMGGKRSKKYKSGKKNRRAGSKIAQYYLSRTGSDGKF